MITPAEIAALAVATFVQRAERLAKLRALPREPRANPDGTARLSEYAEAVASLHKYYQDHPADFVNDWGVTQDPRMAELGLPVALPFTLWTRQREFLDFVYERWIAREDWLAEKSRDCGLSWLCVGFAVWGWQFRPGFIAGFGSRKEEYVDDTSDPKSIFWKVRAFIDWLPAEFKPVGYNPRKHAPFMKVENPATGAMIVGEAGDNIGRGNRTSIYFKDESAFLERPELVDRALSQTSNCKGDVSTPNGPVGPFYRKAHGNRIKKFRFHWRDDPRKDQAWYDKQVEAADDAVLIAQEIDIDYNASTENAWISGALVEAAQRVGPADVKPLGAWIIGVDAAHMGNDKSTIYPRKGRLTLPPTRRGQVDGIELAALTLQRCRELEESMPGERVAAITIELDGPGVSAYDQMRLDQTYGWRVVGLHTGARLDNNKDYNVKAQLWRNAKAYLKDTPCSMPLVDDEGKPIEIKSQIGGYKYSYRDGVLLMEAKKEYKKRVGTSPDDADGWMLTHIDGNMIPEPPQTYTIGSMKTAFRRT